MIELAVITTFVIGFIAGHNWRWDHVKNEQALSAHIGKALRSIKDNSRFIGGGEMWAERRETICQDSQEYSVRIRRMCDSEK